VDEDFIIPGGEQFDRLLYAFIRAREKFQLFLCAKFFDGLTDAIFEGGECPCPSPWGALPRYQTNAYDENRIACHPCPVC